jgi:hypothetical protein
MLHIKIYFIVIIHHYKVTGSICLLLCYYILAVNKHLEFFMEMYKLVADFSHRQDRWKFGLHRDIDTV